MSLFHVHIEQMKNKEEWLNFLSVIDSYFKCYRLVDDQSFKVLSDMDWEKVYAKVMMGY